MSLTARADLESAPFPVTHSVLSVAALRERVLSRYDLGSQVEGVRLNSRGLTDIYTVRTESGERFVLRASRHGWRTDSDVSYEVDALLHLKARGVPVSYPLPDRAGRYVHHVIAPEGRRQLTLFSWAPGTDDFPRLEHGALYGRTVAQIHAATDDLRSDHHRFRIDLAELIDRQLPPIERFLGHRPDDWAYVRSLADQLKERAESLPLSALEWGFCHGDFHGGNCHLQDQVITFFDFDCCGPGWRAYDVSVFLWGGALGSMAKSELRWKRFLAGYREVRPFEGADLDAVPLFVAIRHLWMMGLHTTNGSDWGHGFMHDRYFDRQMKFLRAWEQRRLNRPVPRSWHVPGRQAARKAGYSGISPSAPQRSRSRTASSPANAAIPGN